MLPCGNIVMGVKEPRNGIIHRLKPLFRLEHSEWNIAPHQHSIFSNFSLKCIHILNKIASYLYHWRNLLSTDPPNPSDRIPKAPRTSCRVFNYSIKYSPCPMNRNVKPVTTKFFQFLSLVP